MTTPTALHPDQAATRLDEYTVIDVRTPGEYAAGHLPGSHNIPLDHFGTALPALKAAAARSDLLLVCASGSRSVAACEKLAAADVRAATLTGGTSAWADQGHGLERAVDATAVWPMERQVRLAAGSLVLLGLAVGTSAWADQGHGLERAVDATAVWPMERQVRLAAGSLVLLGLAVGTRYRAARWLSAAIGGGLVFSAATDTCGMAAALAKLPHNRPRTTDLDATLSALQP